MILWSNWSGIPDCKPLGIDVWLNVILDSLLLCKLMDFLFFHSLVPLFLFISVFSYSISTECWLPHLLQFLLYLLGLFYLCCCNWPLVDICCKLFSLFISFLIGNAIHFLFFHYFPTFVIVPIPTVFFLYRIALCTRLVSSNRRRRTQLSLKKIAHATWWSITCVSHLFSQINKYE